MSEGTDGRFERALITGASSGIGAAFAQRLAADGSSLILVARRQERLEALAAELGGAHGVQVEVLAADIGEPGDLRIVAQRISESPDLDLLINNAGFPAYEPIAQLDPDVAGNQIQVHITATVRLSQAALPGMLQRGRGAIINVSSGLSFATPPNRRFGIYPATKAFLNRFTELLAAEVAGTGVRVQALCPTVTESEFHERAGVDVSHVPPSGVVPAEDVVQGSLACLARGEVICVPTLDDPEVLRRLQEAQRQVFQHAGGRQLADRYRQ